MAEKHILRDSDGVYSNPDVKCSFITSFILSKGDVKTNKVQNEFCNVEVLEWSTCFYMALTSGHLGGNDINVLVRRYNSKVYAKDAYDDECRKRSEAGFNKVDVISIYPNCSESAKQFVLEKNLVTQEEAQKIVDENKGKVVDLSKSEPTFELNPKVKKFVKSVYFEANQSIQKSLNPSVFQNDKNPLGTINLRMIQKGEAILSAIGENQNKIAENKEKLKTAKRNIAKYNAEIQMCQNNIVQLSNEYNSTIPRILESGTPDWLLSTPDKVMEQFDLLDNMKLALSSAVLSTSANSDIYSQYKGLNSDITLVTDKKIINQIKEKMQREQLANHHFKTRLVNVFEINQKNAPTFDNSCGNVVTLFHGTRAANLFGILSTHIKLPRNLGPNVQLTGAMFGPGVYFGQYSKSLQYATSRFGGVRNKGNTYYLFLCDVALGKMKFEPSACNYAQAPSGYNSVMGVGEDAFKEGCYITGVGGNEDLKIGKEVFIKTLHSKYSQLLHNEFIVYNQNRFRIRYIIEVEESK